MQMNNDLRGVMEELENLVDDPSTLSLTRLGTTFNLAQSAGRKIGPAQTDCNYWNYWMTYLTGHFELPTPFGYGSVVPPTSPAPRRRRSSPATRWTTTPAARETGASQQ